MIPFSFKFTSSLLPLPEEEEIVMQIPMLNNIEDPFRRETMHNNLRNKDAFELINSSK